MNNKGGISAEVRQKVIRIAQEMGYKAAPGEQYRMINENITIKLLKIAKHGHIVNERHNAFITEYMEGIEDGVRKRHYKLEVSFFNKVPVEEIIEGQKDSTVDGLIVLGTELNAHELAFFSELKQPIVFIDTYFPLSIYDCIDMDNVDGVFKAIQYLYKNGHRNISLVKSNFETRNFRMREYGFREAMEYFSLPIQEKLISAVDPTFDGAMNDMGKYLDKSGSLPSALFCMNDIIAHGCIRAMRGRGIKIPEDVSIIGFDDLPSSSLSEPPLTTIRVSTQRIGMRAVEKLSERIIDHSEEVPENILISGRLIVRESVGKI
ncbi:MAG: substrate-binding domain-containing protein [Treponema sp.]|nr:substrate-binding domain-containing protein [Treponema sp.]